MKENCTLCSHSSNIMGNSERCVYVQYVTNAFAARGPFHYAEVKRILLSNFPRNFDQPCTYCSKISLFGFQRNCMMGWLAQQDRLNLINKLNLRAHFRILLFVYTTIYPIIMKWEFDFVQGKMCALMTCELRSTPRKIIAPG